MNLKKIHNDEKHRESTEERIFLLMNLLKLF